MNEQPNGFGNKIPAAGDDLRDELPADLNASEHMGAYNFPDNSRRRVPGAIYLVAGLLLLILVLLRGVQGPLVNGGLLLGSIILSLFGFVCMTSGWHMTVDEQMALEAAGAAVDFAVGHASAQQVWSGLRSRPTWRVLCYSAEDPPKRRGLVMVDAVTGRVIEHLNEESLEVWSS